MVQYNGSILGTAAEALQNSSIPALRGLHLETDEHDLVLTGRVSSFYHKQLAQETVLPFLERGRLRNQVEVAH